MPSQLHTPPPPPLTARRSPRVPASPLPYLRQSEYDAGAGTVVRDTFVCATLVGEKRVLPAAEGESEQVGGGACGILCCNGRPARVDGCSGH